MAAITLNTKQYLALMRALAAGRVLDEHVADMRDDKGDADLAELWELFMDRAEDFGMSFPEDKEVGEHWSDEMYASADDDLHALIGDEFWHLLADRLAEAAHAKTCEKAAGEHDETCFNDVQQRALAMEEGLDEGVFAQMHA